MPPPAATPGAPHQRRRQWPGPRLGARQRAGAGRDRKRRAGFRLYHHPRARARRRAPAAVSPPQPLTEFFFGAVDRFQRRPVVLVSKRGGRWIPLSHTTLLEHVRALSVGLLELGITPGERVAILSENRPEWASTDFACLAARCANVPVYPTLPAKQVEYILRDSGAVAACVSTATQLAKLRA